jgi:hypothetical protein
MAGLYRRGLVYLLAAPYVHATLRAMQRNAGFVYRTHATARDLVVDHCAHWRDLLDPTHRRLLDIETERLRRTCPAAHEMLLAYLAACLDGVAALAAFDLAVLVVCVWHHVHAQAARGAPLDEATCEIAVNGALKSVRDIVRSNAARHTGDDPYGIARFA